MSSVTFQPTPEQQSVICHDGSAFVMACPGAGKTRVITERARRLLTTMPAGCGVAFLSFTKTAIFELEARLRQERILLSPAFPSFIGTFDSFVWHFFIAPFGLKGRDVRPRLIADLADLPVVPFAEAQPLPLSCFCPITGSIIEYAAKRFGFDASQKTSKQLKTYESTAAAIRARLHEQGHMDFHDARAVALERLKDVEIAPQIAAALASRFYEVIVDEAQDCNPDDLRIISWLRDSGLPVKTVCDPHQSIYEFRGGVTDHLLAFAKTFNEDERKHLTGNFRSTHNICKSIAQFRPFGSRTVDEALGQHKDDAMPVHILSYPGKAVPASIGTTFCKLLVEADIDISLSPVIAATKASGAAASGQPRPNKRRDRIIRLAEAVTGFHCATGFNDMKIAIEDTHQLLLELEGRLEGLSYRQYLADNEVDAGSWRSQVIFILRALRFDQSKHADARSWHAAAKDLLTTCLTLDDSASLAQKLRWNAAVADLLVSVPAATAMPRTIHSVKGMEFPAVCVVTTTSSLGGILDYLEKGEPMDKAEEARKLYVAASRAERLLVIAAPKSQANRLATNLATQGAEVKITKI